LHSRGDADIIVAAIREFRTAVIVSISFGDRSTVMVSEVVPAEINREVIEELNTEMTSLEAGLEECDVSFVSAFRECQQQIQAADEESKNAFAPILAELETASQASLKERRQELERQAELANSYLERMDELRTQLCDLHARTDKDEATLNRTFLMEKNKLIVHGKAHLQEKQKRVAAAQEAADVERKEKAKEEVDDVIRFTSLIDSLDARLQQRSDPRLAEVNDVLTKKTKERNLAKLKFETAGPRDEERLAIERLEGIAAGTPDQLMRMTAALEQAKQTEKPQSRQVSPRPGGPPKVKLPMLRSPGSARI
jgi:hypothetical protein